MNTTDISTFDWLTARLATSRHISLALMMQLRKLSSMPYRSIWKLPQDESIFHVLDIYKLTWCMRVRKMSGHDTVRYNENIICFPSCRKSPLDLQMRGCRELGLLWPTLLYYNYYISQEMCLSCRKTSIDCPQTFCILIVSWPGTGFGKFNNLER